MTPDVSFHSALNSFVLPHETQTPLLFLWGDHIPGSTFVSLAECSRTFLTCRLSLPFHTNAFHRPPPFLVISWDVIVLVDLSFANPAFRRGASRCAIMS